jgi:hypothetical protein
MKDEILLFLRQLTQNFAAQPDQLDSERYHVFRYLSLFQQSFRELKRGNGMASGETVKDAFVLMEPILSTHNPPNIINSCIILPALMVRLERTDLLPIYMDHLKNYANKWYPGSPAAKIATALDGLDWRDKNLAAQLIDLSDASIAVYYDNIWPESSRTGTIAGTKVLLDDFVTSDYVGSVFDWERLCRPVYHVPLAVF